MSDSSDMAAVRGLQRYLKANVLTLEEVYDEWPNHGDEMKVPCCSIITAGTPQYTNLMPYIFKRIEDPDNDLNDLVSEVVGMYDSRIQVDLWTEYKIQRGEFHELILDAINKQYLEGDQPAGLSLTLDNYHDAIAHYDYVGYTYMDSDEGSSKTQWRVKIDIIVNYPRIAVKSIPRISEINVINQIGDNLNVEDDNESVEENLNNIGE